MGKESYEAFVTRIKAMKTGEIIDQGDNLNAMYFLKMSLECNGISTRWELTSEEGTPFGKKVLVLYKD